MIKKLLFLILSFVSISVFANQQQGEPKEVQQQQQQQEKQQQRQQQQQQQIQQEIVPVLHSSK
ncbi:MAG: Na+-transporting methylmalonyl-CoA/oxaloacetate decarboxylase gamma subunit [Bacteriovoracaceae bacterium]|jgi:Na+-transporting methylmalonyl-CoA/oxaloacetate decarboxylase gamma subunit